MRPLRFLLLCAFVVLHLDAQPPIDPANLDRSVDPCEDFYRFANGGWLKNNPIPPEFSMWGSFNVLNEKNAAVLRAILDSAAADTKAKKGTDRRKLGDLYASGMDSLRLERLGASPIAEDLRRIARITDAGGIRKEIAVQQSFSLRTLFRFYADQDEKNSSAVIGQLMQGGLGLPDRDYYFARDERSSTIRSEYRRTMVRLFVLAGDDTVEAQRSADAVLRFETQLAEISATRVERRDPEKNYHRMTIAELDSAYPSFHWSGFLSMVNASHVRSFNVGQPTFFAGIDRMIRAIPAEEWRQYFRWKVIFFSAPVLSAAFAEEHFRFTGTVLTGAPRMQPRWKRVLGTVNSAMGEALGRQYVAAVFPPEAKVKARAMVDDLIAAFRERIMTLAWMDDTTRSAALKKLSSFSVKIGYPDVWEDYASLMIVRDDYLGNLRRAGAFAFRTDIATIGKPVDRTKWGMMPQTVNAYYNANLNEIVFPAAILQPPFFDPNADDAVNFGAMGAVIGHELTHGFDDQGSKYDGEGNLRSWWTDGTRRRFNERVARLRAQYDAYVAIDSLSVNGALTSGENIADLGGLSVAYTALQKRLDTRPNLHRIDGFTPAQRFFLSWAQVWRRNYRDDALRLQVRTDSHSPAMFRTNGPLSNMGEFHEAFGCSTGGNVRTTDGRVSIW